MVLKKSNKAKPIVPKKTVVTGKKVGKKEDSLFTKDDIGKYAEEYADISTKIKTLEKRKKELSDIIKKGSVDYGVKDDKGSSYLDTNGYTTGNVCKVSMSFDQEKGVAYLEKKGLGDLVDVETVKTINEDRLEKAVGEKRITLKEVEKFTNKKVSYQVSVKSVEEMPEVESSTLALAAKKK